MINFRLKFVCILLLTLLSCNLFAQRIDISDQLEKSSTDSMFVMTDSLNEQQYITAAQMAQIVAATADTIFGELDTSYVVALPEDFGAIGDGVTDDQAAFSSLISYISGKKYHIHITKDYVLSAGFTLPPGIKMSGHGKLILGDDATVTLGSRSMVEDIEVTGGDTNSVTGAFSLVGDYQVIRNVTFTNINRHAITCDGNTGVKIDGNKFLNIVGCGIYAVRSSTGLHITNNYFNTVGTEGGIWCGIKVTSTFGGFDYTNEGLLVANNTLIDCARLAIEVWVNAPNSRVTGNMIKGSGGVTGAFGISYVYADNGVCNGNSILADGDQYNYGIEVAYCNNVTINDNTIDGVDIGISFNGSPVSDSINVVSNNIDNSQDEGIRINGAYANVTSNVITNSQGIILNNFGGSDVVFTNNVGNTVSVVDGAVIKNTGTATAIGNIFVTTATNPVLSVNSGSVLYYGRNMIEGNKLESTSGLIKYLDGGKFNPTVTDTLGSLFGTTSFIDKVGKKYLQIESTSASSTKTLNIKNLDIANTTTQYYGAINVRWVGRLNDVSYGGEVYLYRGVFSNFDANPVMYQTGSAVDVNSVFIDGSGHPNWEIDFPTNANLYIEVQVFGTMANSDKWVIYFDEIDDLSTSLLSVTNDNDDHLGDFDQTLSSARSINMNGFDLTYDGSSFDVTIKSSGRVGIGTNAPSVQLHSFQNNAAAARIRTENTNGFSDFLTESGYAKIGAGGYDNGIIVRPVTANSKSWADVGINRVPSGNTLDLETAFGQRFFIEENGGRVGINVSDAIRQLHVNGLLRFENISTSGTATDVLMIESDGDVFSTDLSALDDHLGDFDQTLSGNRSVDMGTNTLSFTNGDFGIGTVPSVDFHVTGAVRFDGIPAGSPSAAIGINGLGDILTFPVPVSTNIYTADGILSGDRTVTQSGNKLTFVGGALIADSLGIGTSTPTHQLDVSGAIRSDSIGVGTSPAVDFHVDGNVRFSSIPAGSPTGSLGINGLGDVVSFTVPVNTNIYSTDGVLPGERTMTQSGHQMKFIGGAVIVDSLAIGTTTPGAELHSTGSVIMENIPSGTISEYLGVDGSGNVLKSTIDTSLWEIDGNDNITPKNINGSFGGSTNNVGINRTSPAFKFDVLGDTRIEYGPSRRIEFDNFGSTEIADQTTLTKAMSVYSNSSNAIFAGNRARTSESTPGVVLADDRLLQIAGAGYNGTQFATGGSLLFDANETFSATDESTRLTYRSSLLSGGAETDMLVVNETGAGDFRLNQYGDGNITGTITQIAAFDTDGNMIESTYFRPSKAYGIVSTVDTVTTVNTNLDMTDNYSTSGGDLTFNAASDYYEVEADGEVEVHGKIRFSNWGSTAAFGVCIYKNGVRQSNIEGVTAGSGATDVREARWIGSVADSDQLSFRVCQGSSSYKIWSGSFMIDYNRR